jgi:RluA family pseudouridine synthase
MDDPITLLHQDDDLVVVDKPSGVTVVPAPGTPRGACVHGRLEAQLGVKLWVVHRLDRDTSGVMLFARHAEMHRELCEAFEHRQVRKTYVAFTAGLPFSDGGVIDMPLHAARRGKSRPARPGEPGSRDASTRIDVRQAWRLGWASVARVDAQPGAGRHHQIRVHLRAVGTPILFDTVYGRGRAVPGEDRAPCRRLALHAARLAMPDLRGTGVTWVAPLAPDLEALARWLDAEAASTATS